MRIRKHLHDAAITRRNKNQKKVNIKQNTLRGVAIHREMN